MKIARFLRGSEPGLGAVVGDELVDLRSADPAIPLDAVALLDPDSEARRRAEEALARGPRIALSEVRLQAPVPRPPKFLAVARALSMPLVTEDARLRAAAPRLTVSLGEALER